MILLKREMRTLICLQKSLLKILNYSRWCSRHVTWTRSRLYSTTSREDAVTGENQEFTWTSSKEGKAEIFYPERTNYFFDPHQEIFRDLSVTVLQEYAKYREETLTKSSKTKRTESKVGLTILDICSGVGAGAMRYALEVPGINKIIVNESVRGALDMLTKNIRNNQLDHVLEPREQKIRNLMYTFIQDNKKFDVLELATSRSSSEHFDAAVQNLNDGGLLIATFKNLNVCTKSIEGFYSRFGATSFDCEFNKEMAIRIVLQAIDCYAYRYFRHITPLLSFHGSSCIKLYVLLHDGVSHQAASKRGFIYKCTGCETFHIQPLGVSVVSNDKKTSVPASGPPISPNCKHCGSSHQVAGPVWLGNLNDKEFVSKVINNILADPSRLKNSRRLLETLTIIQEELEDCPFYYVLERMSEFLHTQSPRVLNFRSALMHANYRVSQFHGSPTAIKTNASSDVIWDFMRCWDKEKPQKKVLAEDSPAFKILNQEPRIRANFNLRVDAEIPNKQIKLQLPEEAIPEPVRRTKSKFSKLN